MSDSMQKILEEMRTYDGAWNVPRVWADRIEAQMREPVAWIEYKTAGVYTISPTKDGVNYRPLFSAPPDAQAFIDAARGEIVEHFMEACRSANSEAAYSRRTAQGQMTVAAERLELKAKFYARGADYISSLIGKPLEKKP